MKKIVALLLSISMIAGIAVGCKKSKDTTESTTESSVEQSSDASSSETESQTEASQEPEGTKPADDPDAGFPG